MGETGSGHAVVMDGAPEGGGRNLGPRPMELVLLGTAGCTSYDVLSILRKSRQDVRDCWVELDAERAEVDPKVFTRIHFHFVVTGRGLKADAVVFDAPVAIYYAKNDQDRQIEIVGELFEKQKYGIALREGSEWREPINRAVLKIVESGRYDALYKKWFGENLTMEV